MTLPPWPGPTTPESPWSEVADRLDHQLAERRAQNKTPLPHAGATQRQGKRDTRDAREQG